jgi:hypothetical protein
MTAAAAVTKPEPILRLEGVTKTYADLRVVDAVTTDVQPGEVVSVRPEWRRQEHASALYQLLDSTRCRHHPFRRPRRGGRERRRLPTGAIGLTELRRSVGMVFQSFDCSRT